ncbi:ribonuclease J [Dolichospermum circinale CS-1225]|uniref:Ribonuclease J n=1 Tax=Dolichospermum circinale CS-537/01 TaxID=3021739 RepID=A0ABT5A8R7_9CYAN|nr:ribonuclease J [Dolichospermum circinale]MDB9460003.1 ribonuclease J [Dolichospermum circinale CS-545/17]MDB9454732.1 ribonuclease J [Dolichospermum circinale CS-541/06]MDB9460915.1 ribonuclease J [Dolichospermum circinale CS-541/04]MDB9467407.1 ribonuclease J [Dolichospermum circinale CS-539/09]MDB9471569.1 ribonuclease J [Dolichospermum circinale CS-539]
MVKTEANSALKIIPLGGLHEIGKNTCVFEYEDEIILLDAGLAFPTEAMHGVNIVLPDTTYLRENRHKIKGMIVTHGHEDHIGGIAFHLKQFDIPVIHGPRLALAMLEGKLEEAGVRDRTELRTVLPRDVVRIGKHFFVEYIRNTHSIADSFTVAIHTPLGVVIHTGDFKIDHTPVDGETFDLQRLAEHGEKGVLCLLSDSTNAEVPGFTPSERSVFPNLDRVFYQATGRLFVTTFASSVHRINMILQLAKKHNRVVTVVGRSMLNLIAHARNLGYIKCEDSLFQPLHTVRGMPDERVLILTTGSQGETMAAMTRIANKEHPHIKIRPGDTVAFSANPIPGNTIAVVNTIDKLMIQGAKVVYGRDKGIHVSGHGCQEEQKLMIALTRPKFFVPFHGEHRMLVKHSETAQSMGIPAENIVIIKNGDVIELTENSIRVSGQVAAGIELVDTSSSGMVSSKVLEERQRMASEGMVTIAAAIDWSGKLMAKPELHMQGVVTSIERSLLQKWVQQRIEEILSVRWLEFSPAGGQPADTDWGGLQETLERELARSMRRELQCQPALTLLMQVPEEPPVKVADGRRRRTRSTAVAS